MEFNAQITKLVKKYSGNTYNTCRNTPDFMCDLKLFSKSCHNFYLTVLLEYIDQ